MPLEPDPSPVRAAAAASHGHTNGPVVNPSDAASVGRLNSDTGPSLSPSVPVPGGPSPGLSGGPGGGPGDPDPGGRAREGQEGGGGSPAATPKRGPGFTSSPGTGGAPGGRGTEPEASTSAPSSLQGPVRGIYKASKGVWLAQIGHATRTWCEAREIGATLNKFEPRPLISRPYLMPTGLQTLLSERANARAKAWRC